MGPIGMPTMAPLAYAWASLGLDNPVIHCKCSHKSIGKPSDLYTAPAAHTALPFLILSINIDTPGFDCASLLQDAVKSTYFILSVWSILTP